MKLTSTAAPQLDAALIQRLYRRARADRWALPVEAFAASLARSAQHAFAGDSPQAARDRYFDSLHLEELALACACAESIDSAWDHFVTTYRPALYRAADAIDPTGAAREAADSLYAELYGLSVRDGERQSHFRYFHGRSSLSTWLRAVLSQRYVDRIRREARLTPLPSDEGADATAMTTSAAAPSAQSLRDVERLGRVLTTVIERLAPRDRLRLRCYYSQDLTLAQIGKLLGEHEATVSRNLTRTRREIREGVEVELREHEGLSEAEITECFAAALEDPGPLNVADLMGPEPGLEERRKKVAPDRSY